MRKAGVVIGIVLVLHAAGLAFDLYGVFDWYDIPMHIGGGVAMGALALAIWHEGIEDVKFKGALQRHLKWWFIPAMVLGFVAFIGVLWELHEWALDLIWPTESLRQPNLPDTMLDFINDLLGGIIALLIWKKK